MLILEVVLGLPQHSSLCNFMGRSLRKHRGNVGLAPLQKCVGDFCCINFGDFVGDFPGGFFWALFPTKMRKNNPATKSVKKFRRPKIEICDKKRSAKNQP